MALRNAYCTVMPVRRAGSATLCYLHSFKIQAKGLQYREKNSKVKIVVNVFYNKDFLLILLIQA